MDILIRNRLSRLMGERRWTIQEVAHRSGLSYPTVLGLYHERTRRIDLDTLDALCRVFECQPGDLLEYEPEQQP